MASEGGHGQQTSGEYISHHLQNLQVCKDDTGAWIWNHCAGNPMGINVDSMFWSVLLGLVFIWLFWGAARKSSAGKPTRFQAFVEIGPRNAMLLMTLNAPMTAVLGTLFLGETYTAIQWAGIAIALAGIAWVILSGRDTEPAAAH